MKKVYEFTKLRYIAPIASLTIIILLFIITGARGGFNLGIDFLSGLNMRVQINSSVKADISDMRTVLAPAGATQIQVVGDPADQMFSIRVRETGEQTGVAVSDKVKSLLESKFTAANVTILQSEFSGPRFSKTLSMQSVWLIILSLALMLIYIWFRFRLAYGLSAIMALAHDALVMVGVIGALQLEVDVTTIAAVLTIIGYSLNATIVIFDRVKENIIMLKGSPLKQILNTSISQSLSRGIITSLTTLIAVVAIYVFGLGLWSGLRIVHSHARQSVGGNGQRLCRIPDGKSRRYVLFSNHPDHVAAMDALLGWGGVYLLQSCVQLCRLEHFGGGCCVTAFL